MRIPLRLVPLLPALVFAAAACSTIGDDGEAVAIEFLVPVPALVEVNDTIQLRARVLDQNGDSIEATIRWRTPDTTVAADSVTGRFWGLSGSTGRVQPVVGTLVGPLAIFTVRPRTDTIIVSTAAESLFVLTTDSVSADLAPKVAQTDGTGLAGRSLVITLIAPSPAGARLTGDVVADTVTTAGTGLPATPIRVRKVGVVAGDSVIVQVEARRPSGAVVSGSGQVIRVYFQ